MADQKTEQPTKKRLQKARDEGSVPSARHFIGGVQFCIFVSLLAAKGGSWLASAVQGFRAHLVRGFHGDLTAAGLLGVGYQVTLSSFVPVLIFGTILMASGLAIQLTVTKFGFAPQKLLPSPKRLNPLDRLRELPQRNLIAMLQSLVLLPIFAFAIYAVVGSQAEQFMLLPLATLRTGIFAVSDQIKGLLWKAAGIFLLFGCVELLREARHNSSNLRMTKQEVKDESKETDGNPQIKARIRTIRRDQARKRMMQAVPTATAVIVNPTHFAVALKYEAESMVAPIVVAKGKNYLALRIRQKALDHNVPLIENPPLARALYKSADVGQEIPPHLYRAIAEILAYIFRVTNKEAMKRK